MANSECNSISSRERMLIVVSMAVLTLARQSMSFGSFGNWECARQQPVSGGVRKEVIASGAFDNPDFAPFLSPDEDIVEPVCQRLGRRRYMHNVTCRYDFQGPYGYYVYVEFASFKLDLDCTKDFVTLETTGAVRDGLRTRRYVCGRRQGSRKRRDSLVVATNAVRLTFRTDGSHSCRGFSGFFHSFSPVRYSGQPGRPGSAEDGSPLPGCFNDESGRKGQSGPSGQSSRQVMSKDLMGASSDIRAAPSPGGTTTIQLQRRYCQNEMKGRRGALGQAGRAKRGAPGPRRPSRFKGDPGFRSPFSSDVDSRFRPIGEDGFQPGGPGSSHTSRYRGTKNVGKKCGVDFQLRAVTADLDSFSPPDLQRGREILSGLDHEDSCLLQTKLCKETGQCMRFSKCRSPTTPPPTVTPAPQTSEIAPQTPPVKGSPLKGCRRSKYDSRWPRNNPRTFDVEMLAEEKGRFIHEPCESTEPVVPDFYRQRKKRGAPETRKGDWGLEETDGISGPQKRRLPPSCRCRKC